MYAEKEQEKQNSINPNYASKKLAERLKKSAYPDNLPKIDYDAFAKDMNDIRKEINENLGKDDITHLKKIENWGRFCTLSGYLTSWIIPNPVSAFLIGIGNVARWTMITHHVSHRGYDRVPDIEEKYTSKKYAVGVRRFIDWLDWMLPEAWNHEHNVLHHYHTGEISDPDLVEKSMELVRELNVPVIFKYSVILFFMSTWKLSYYAPNTLWILQRTKRKGEKSRDVMDKIPAGYYPGTKLFIPFYKGSGEFLLKCVLPYGLFKFVLIPSLFLPLGKTAATFVLINSIAAELIANIYSFIIIVPNHAGDDLYRFDTPVTDQAEFYVRQVTGSVNFTCGNDFIDFLHGWLNYQIEHHVFPDIPMLKYQQYQPKIKAVCEKHGVPYVQQNVFKRFIKLIRIMIGKDSMIKTATIPKNMRLKSIN